MCAPPTSAFVARAARSRRGPARPAGGAWSEQPSLARVNRGHLAVHREHFPRSTRSRAQAYSPRIAELGAAAAGGIRRANARRTMMKQLTRYASGAIAAVLLVGCQGDPSQPVSSAPVAATAAPSGAVDVPSSPEAKGFLSTLRGRLGLPAESALVAAGPAEGFRAEAAGLRPRFGASGEPVIARVLFPQQSLAALHLEDVASGLAVDVRLIDARASQAQVAEGFLVYPNAHVSGATLLHRALPAGLEDYLSFEKAPAVAQVSYEVTLGTSVNGLRLVEGVLEMLDAGGAPRLRVTPPFLIGADGTQTAATLSVEGCAVDTAQPAPWGRPVTAPGAKTCFLRVTWNDASVKYPALLDPRWTSTASMAVARQEHTATLLSNGKVLVTGGRSDATTAALFSAELYDRTTGTWTSAGNIVAPGTTKAPRRLHTAVQLGTTSNANTSGRVLVAGGINGTTSVATTSLYNVTANTWTAGPSTGAAGAPTNPARHEHTATLMPNGNVVVIGGLTNATVLNSAAIYNPGGTGTGSWSAVNNLMATPRRGHTATLLLVPGNATLNNKILVVGGNNGASPPVSVTSTQIFDGSTTWSSGQGLAAAREGQTATALANGNVLITGGKTVTSTATTVLQSSHVYNAQTGTGTWSATAGTLTSKRVGHTATLLPAALATGGKSVLLVGGSTTGSDTLGTAEVWDGATTWTTAPALSTSVPIALGPVKGHTATLLGTNLVLLTGGVNGTTPIKTAGLYDASFGLACTSASQCASGFCSNGVCCDTACTGQCSACNLPGTTGICSPKPVNTACNDNVSCTHTDVCNTAGVCGGTAITCSSDSCNTRACNGTPTCAVTPLTGPACDDGKTCTTGDTCVAGACTGTVSCAPPTGPNAACLAGSCNGSGQCAFVAANQGSPCSDGNACTSGDTCQSGACAPSGPATCPAGSNITFYQSFDHGTTADLAAVPGSEVAAQTGYSIVHAPGLFGLAEDPSTYPWLGYGATDSTRWDIALWKPGSVSVWIKPASAFTGTQLMSTYDGGSGVNLFLIADPTEVRADLFSGTDGHYLGGNPIPWTPDDRWHLVVLNWSRTGVALSVDGSAPWFVPIPELAGMPIVTTGGYLISPMAGGVGDYAKDELLILNRPMTTSEIQWYYSQRTDPPLVNPAIAYFQSSAAACSPIDDQNPCTADSCDPVLGPVNTKLSGISCDDGNACNGVAMCNAGACVPGAPLSADDGNPCTVDSCNPSTGVAHAAASDGTACNDDNACTTADSCQAGTCVGASPVACAAPDLCHGAGTCNPSNGTCSYPPAPSGTGCSDGNACNGVESCDGYGVCHAGTPVVCVGSTECDDVPTCDPASGACSDPGGIGCTVFSAPPEAGLSVANVADPTPSMEPGCKRLRDIPVRFLDYRSHATGGASPLDNPAYLQGVIQELSASFARACLTFHERGHATIWDTKFNMVRTLQPDNTWTYENTPFDWADPQDRASWPLAVPYNPTCSLVPPTAGGETSGRMALLNRMLQICPFNDELTIMSMEGVIGGDSAFPTRNVDLNPGDNAHEVGHNFGLQHIFEGIGWAKATPDRQGAVQTAADWWDLVYLPGNASVPDKFYQTPDAVIADMQAGKNPVPFFVAFGINLPGVSTNAFPPKTSVNPGDPSCENPPAPPGVVDPFLGPCSMEPAAQAIQRQGAGDGYCYLCEYRRMYEAYSGPNSFPPPDATPLGFMVTPGQSLADWQANGSFRDGFAGFSYEHVGATSSGPSDPARALAPFRTRLQTNQNSTRVTKNAMAYWESFWIAGGVSDYGKFRGFANSQVVLIKNALKYDFEATNALGAGVPPQSATAFGHRPAYGSWERIGQSLLTDTTPTIVAAPDGVFVAAQANDGQVAYRHWNYADPPWASTSSSTTPVTAPAWLTVLETTPPSPSGWLSAAYRPNADRLDIALHQVGGGVDEIQNAVIDPGSDGMWGWGSLGGNVRGSPILRSRLSAQGDHLDALVLGSQGVPTNDRYFLSDWSPVSESWADWLGLPLLPGPVDDGFDASTRSDGTIDFVAMTDDGNVHNIKISNGASTSGWIHLGKPGAGPGFRPSISQSPAGKVFTQSSFLRLAVAVTDVSGAVFTKNYNDIFSEVWSTNWLPIGGSNFGRTIVTINNNGDRDFVARDLDRKTVRFKRYRNGVSAWSPSQDAWFDLGGEGIGEPIAIPRRGAPDVVDVFGLDQDGSLWHRAFVVPPFVADPDGQQYEVDYATYCCEEIAGHPSNPACPCIQ